MTRIPFYIFLILLIGHNPTSNIGVLNPRNKCELNIDNNAEAIIGKWITIENNLEVLVYKQEDNFQAKITWFKMDDSTKPINEILDEKNPNPNLRKRKWIGMEVLRGLKYDAENNEWRGGSIYDAKHGREWNSVIWINKQGLLKVKGYWVFRWISQTMTFKKVL